MIEPKIYKHLSRIEASPTLRINEESKEIIKEGGKLVQFGFGQSPFPVPDIIVSTLQEHAHQKDYLPVKGLFELRQTFARHQSALTQTDIRPEQIMIGPGSKEIIHLVQMTIDADLILPSPSWVSYAPQASFHGKKVHWINTSPHWKLKAKDLDEYCSSHNLKGQLIILNYPNNPTGLTFTSRELEELANACRKHELIVLSDEIYGLLSFDGQYRSIASYYPEGTIVTTGLSKWCGAGGWRLGLCVIPEKWQSFTEILSNLASETFSAVSAPIQYAAIKAYEQHVEIDDYLHAVRNILAFVAKYCHDKLVKSGIKVHPSNGGFYLYLDFGNFKEALLHKSIFTSEHLCRHLLHEYNVALLPGESFGRPKHEWTARLAFVDFDGQKALKRWIQQEKFTASDIQELFSDIDFGLKKITSCTIDLNSLITKTQKYENQKLSV